MNEFTLNKLVQKPALSAKRGNFAGNVIGIKFWCDRGAFAQGSYSRGNRFHWETHITATVATFFKLYTVYFAIPVSFSFSHFCLLRPA